MRVCVLISSLTFLVVVFLLLYSVVPIGPIAIVDPERRVFLVKCCQVVIIST